MTIYIAPDCPADIDALIRREAAAKGETVMPSRPFPWNRKRRQSVAGLSYLPGQTEIPGTAPACPARRLAQAPLRPSRPQLPCDHGLFSDEAAQLDLVEMLQDPVED
jgi:hypothetical protein